MIADSPNQLISDKAVYRTAPATPGLLMTGNGLKLDGVGHVYNNPSTDLLHQITQKQ